ncbi:DHA2 family efflux MFS transporter permease subunit [Cryobacterium melibiosiphilum]|uniref:DHA2 family efflux MFS transporter permease subunit n=1 Tax=Cryobacterium melibiosiphilum TaxID=995039 RepID=A0A3A5MF46_9MICO|nr:DHA2 family efflux MFS transporter permease subunit [Cryobacterium melibiosiphilum]RJT88052.1 DHA2 family efflux MFS transporter permease subunit [Cryobacterium melibiosiphilum]
MTTSHGSAPSSAQRLVLGVAVLASFIAFLDGTVINVALPAITRDLGGGIATQQWVVDAYLITLGAIILLAGSLSDAFGRKRVLFWGLVGFLVTSVLCAAAPTASVLIVARGLQGVAGALLVPSSLALILSTFSGAAQAKAIGSWTAFTSTAFLAGPLIGGLLVDLASWRLVFAINVLPIAVTLLLLARLPKDRAPDAGARVDVVGAVLGVLGLGLPVFALIEQANFGWASPVILAPAIVGVAAFVGFLFWERRAPQPMMPLGLFSVRNFWVGNVATTFIYSALSLGSFVLAVFLQQVGGYSATLAGLALLPVTIFSILLAGLFGTLAGRIGPRLFMTIGPIIAGTGFIVMLRIGPDALYWSEVFPGVVIFGLGLTITVAPLTSAILGAIDPGRAGIASAVNNAVSRVAGLIAIASASVIVGAELDLDGLHRAVIVTGVLLMLGGVVSGFGIVNPPRAPVVKAARETGVSG